MKTKKILQSIVLLLLLLAISSNLLASSYSRTAGGSWDDWGWSADWIPPFSFPIGQALALGLGGGAVVDLNAALKARKAISLAESAVTRALGDAGRWVAGRSRVYAGSGTLAGYFMNKLVELEVSYRLLLRSSISQWLGAMSVEAVDFVLGVSTPNFFQFLPDSTRSGVDTFQLGWSKTAGPWLYYFTWWLLGTPGGMFDDVTLFNEGADPLNFDLKGDRTLNGLNVVGNSWTLSSSQNEGTLTFRTWVPNGYGILRYSGPQTLTVETRLNLPQGLLMHVPDRDGTVRLLGEVNLGKTLRKTGYGTLLMEAPLHVHKGWFNGFFDPLNRWTGKRSLRLVLDGGTLGIAPASLMDDQLDFFVSDDANFFALNGDINIPWTLCISPDTQLDVIDNPNDPTNPHDITFSGDKYDHGTINQRSYGDLIFEGTDHFEGTINTYNGYGRLVLNGDTRANIQMNGGEIAGIGGTRGDLTARNGAIISPGYNGRFGTCIV